MEAKELREMSDEQLDATLKQTCNGLFRLRIQAQVERLDAPSELKRNRRLVARIKTIQSERKIAGRRGSSTGSIACMIVRKISIYTKQKSSV